MAVWRYGGTGSGESDEGSFHPVTGEKIPSFAQDDRATPPTALPPYRLTALPPYRLTDTSADSTPDSAWRGRDRGAPPRPRDRARTGAGTPATGWPGATSWWKAREAPTAGPRRRHR